MENLAEQADRLAAQQKWIRALMAVFIIWPLSANVYLIQRFGEDHQSLLAFSIGSILLATSAFVLAIFQMRILGKINKNPDLKQMMNDEQSRYVTRKSASISYGLIFVIMSPIWLAFSFGILEPRLAMTIAFASVSTINPIVSAMVR